jgi:capsular polysaccharide biosynthesis protein
VVGVHGSALTNLIFCQRGTRVIELFSREYVNPCYLDLCNVAGLVHHSIIADKGNTSNLRIKLELTDSQSDIQLNIKDTITDIKRILNVAN